MLGQNTDRIGDLRQVIHTRQRGLPAGVRQADCDGLIDELADADGHELWRACDPAQHEVIALQFADARADVLRDALLESQDAPSGTRHSGPQAAASADDIRAQALGRALWPAWIAYRDRRLNDLNRFGRLAL